MSTNGLTTEQIHAIRHAILADDLTKPGVARRLVLRRVEKMALTDEEWAALVTLIQIFEMHGLSLAVLRGLAAMLGAAAPQEAARSQARRLHAAKRTYLKGLRRATGKPSGSEKSARSTE